MGYYVKPIVCDYGVYNDYDNELCLVCNRKANAELIVKILEVDNGNDAEHHHDKVCRDYEPDCIRKPMERILNKLEEAKDSCKHYDMNGKFIQEETARKTGICQAIKIIEQEYNLRDK